MTTELSHSWLLPPIVTYAHNFEDVILRRALQDVPRGFWIDLGASDPVDASCTHWFHQLGWRGVNVEPNPSSYGRLCEERAEDTNINAAVTEHPGRCQLHLFGDKVGCATTVANRTTATERAEGTAVSQVLECAAVTLEHLFETYASDKVVDFLKIDIEGAEAAVILSTDFKKWRPRIILVEALQVASEEPLQFEPAWHEWEPYLIECGYLFAYFDGVNRFFVRSEDKNLLPYFISPPCSFDQVRFLNDDERVLPSDRPDFRAAFSCWSEEKLTTRVSTPAAEIPGWVIGKPDDHGNWMLDADVDEAGTFLMTWAPMVCADAARLTLNAVVQVPCDNLLVLELGHWQRDGTYAIVDRLTFDGSTGIEVSLSNMRESSGPWELRCGWSGGSNVKFSEITVEFNGQL